ncbi:MAG: hypothetical protein H6Q00_77 [Holophagaceae bacterium]|nr:hypothetical protein [Holophagaceae bacterium]
MELKGACLIQLYVDADACPVKEEVFRVAKRHGLTVHVVANSRINLPRDPLFKLVVVSGRFDAADDWIVEQAGPTDIAITSDIPLASRCLKKGARVLDPKGRVFTDDSIGDALASRELSAFLRDMGEMGGGPKPYSPRDRSQFLNTLENQIQALLKAGRLQPRTPQP